MSYLLLLKSYAGLKKKVISMGYCPLIAKILHPMLWFSFIACSAIAEYIGYPDVKSFLCSFTQSSIFPLCVYSHHMVYAILLHLSFHLVSYL